jgi:alpha-methylacyl-CoA racemase
MTLADLGADVVRVDRPHADDLFSRDHDLLNRGKRSVILDLKRPEAVSAALALVDRADVLIEGYRPQTLERLGLGPDVCLERSSRLIYGRVTGWGQTGPLAMAAGHDIDYIALNGLLHAVGDRGGRPKFRAVSLATSAEAASTWYSGFWPRCWKSNGLVTDRSSTPRSWTDRRTCWRACTP